MKELKIIINQVNKQIEKSKRQHEKKHLKRLSDKKRVLHLMKSFRK